MKQMKDPIETCPNCGAQVYFFDPLWNKCDNCHRWYNGVGQEVISPEAWDADPENTEKVSDIYNEHDQEEIWYSDGIL